MLSEQEFWWNWWVYFFTAVGTVGAVVVALFGEWLRAHLWPPKLNIELSDDTDDCVPTTWEKTEDGTSGKTQSRWCHVRVKNERRFMSPATEVQLLLLSVEEPDAAGNFKVRWNSEVPLCWRDQPFKPQTFKIGRPREADLFSVVESVAGGPPHLQLSPAYAPSTLQYKWHSPCKLALTIQASGVEADSNKLRVEVAWDGKWSNDPKAMRHHLTIIAATSDEGPDRALKPQLQA